MQFMNSVNKFQEQFLLLTVKSSWSLTVVGNCFLKINSSKYCTKMIKPSHSPTHVKSTYLCFLQNQKENRVD